MTCTLVVHPRKLLQNTPIPLASFSPPLVRRLLCRTRSPALGLVLGRYSRVYELSLPYNNLFSFCNVIIPSSSPTAHACIVHYKIAPEYVLPCKRIHAASNVGVAKLACAFSNSASRFSDNFDTHFENFSSSDEYALALG